tara:strand:+ start:404 stop:511 length:108 start_codon:yes stop_codon:yes gene_type:complete
MLSYLFTISSFDWLLLEGDAFGGCVFEGVPSLDGP